MASSAVLVEAVGVEAGLTLRCVARYAAGHDLCLWGYRRSATVLGLCDSGKTRTSMQIVHSMTSLSYVDRRYDWSSRIVRVERE